MRSRRCSHRSNNRSSALSFSRTFLPCSGPIGGLGVCEIPRKITASPVLDLHSGFPHSALDELQNYVGQPDSYRLPTLAAFDLRLSRDSRVPLLPWVKNHKLRGALTIYNITNHPNPRDVYNSIASPYFGHVTGFQRRMFDTDLDLVY